MAVKQYVAAGGVVVQQGIVAGLDPARRYLLVLDRPTRDEVRLPKGHIDDGESARAAALRETAEEAGYTDLELLGDLGSQLVEYDYQGHHYIRHERYFLMALRSSAQIERNESDARQFQVRWIPVEEAAAQLTYPAEQYWAERAIECLRSQEATGE
jgi:8-oxo-dGTP pyrophosphatase MutT (NUDIX family)